MDEKKICSIGYIRIVKFLEILFFAGILFNIIILHYQCDPFISATIAMGMYIQDSGSIDNSDFMFSNSGTGFWEGLSVDYLTYIPGSGILVSVGSQITDLPVTKFSYLPIPYLILFLILCCFIIRVYNFICTYFGHLSKWWNIGLVFTFMTSALSFIGFYCVGKWYLFEYHSLYLIYSLLIFYLIVTSIFKENITYYKRSFFLIFVLYASLLFTHYQYPYTIIFGLSIFLICLAIFQCCQIVSGKNTLYWLFSILLLFILLISFQQFYFTISHVPISDLFNMLSQKVNIIGNPDNSQDIISKYIIYINGFKKAWHILILCVTLITFVFSIFYFKVSNLKINSSLYFLYALFLGINIAWILSYFSQYGISFGIELKDIWIINLFLVLPILLFNHSNLKFWKNIALLLGIIFIVSNISLCGWLVFDVTSSVSGYSSFPYQVKSDMKGLDNYLIHNSDSTKAISVSGSIQASSAFFESLIVNNKEKLGQFIINPSIVIMPPKNKTFYGGQNFYESLISNDVSKFILTDHEIRHGYYGGLSSKPLNQVETEYLDSMLGEKSNLIYNSKRAKLYDLDV